MRASGARAGGEWTHRLRGIVFFVVLAGLWLAMSGHAQAADGPIFAGPAVVAPGQAPAAVAGVAALAGDEKGGPCDLAGFIDRNAQRLAGAVQAMFEQGRESRFQGGMVQALGDGVDSLFTEGHVAPTPLTL